MLMLAGLLLPLTLATKQPHILFMLSDDLGFSDVGFHGGTQIPTPNLDTLAANGAVLSSYYVQPVCSPTRATIMTGRHVIHTGVYDPMNGGSGDLSLNFTLLPQHLQALGYTCHMVGKWHLGMSSWRFTPLQRGFETYFGYLGGGEDYWIHGTDTQLDFWNGTAPDFSHTCWQKNDCPHEFYSTNVFAERAVAVIEAAAKQPKPFFLYLAWQAVHSGGHLQLQAPQDYIDSFNDTAPAVLNNKRRELAGMVRSMDEGVGNVTRALRDMSMLDNTLIIFSTDNGGPADGFNGNMACNWPLRGMKRTLWEGGVRGVGMVSGAGLTKKGKDVVLSGFFHAADWLPTLLAAAGSTNWHETATASASEPPFLLGDGMNLWPYISGVAQNSSRTEILHEAHTHGSSDGNGNALRVGDYKIVIRTGGQWSTGSHFGSNDGWYGGPGSTDKVTGAYGVKTGNDDEDWFIKCPPPPSNITEGFACEQAKGSAADAPQFTCLFNIADDPCEHQDLSTSQPAILKELLTRLEAFRATSVVSTVAHPNPDGHECPANAVASKGASTPIAPGGCSGAGAQAPMSCGTQLPCTPGHEPPSPPPPPVPTNGRSLRNAQTNKCLLDSLEFGSCGTSSNVWAQAETGALMVGYQMLKILKSPANDGCGGWSTVHMGVGRGDNNTITIVAQHKGSAILASSECSGRCVAVDPEGGVSLGDCSAKTAGGWALQNA